MQLMQCKDEYMLARTDPAHWRLSEILRPPPVHRGMEYPLLIGHDPEEGTEVRLPIHALLRHAVALGASGSGKTVLCKVLVEECIRHRLPVICIDPQGDLASLGLCEDPDKLKTMGVPPEVAHEYHSRVDLKIWTPGSTHGIPVSIAPAVTVGGIQKREDRLRAFASIANSLASISSSKDESAVVAYSMILEYADEQDLAIDNLNDFANFLADPPLPLARRLDTIFAEKDRKKAEKAFRLKMMGSNRLLFDLGKAINVDALFGYEEGGAYDQGKARVSVIYLNSLGNQEEKEIFVAMLASAIYRWMLQKPASNPMGLLYIDEVAPYMPPVKKPASKEGLMLLLRQARKYGLCCLLATQSPGDLDYKGLGQIGTWALGKMTTMQEAYKVEPSLRAAPGVDSSEIVESLPGLPKGRFHIINADHFEGAQECQVRWLASRHECLSPDRVEELTSDLDREIYG